MIIDTHAHINTTEFENRIDEVIELANSNNVEKIVVVGMDHTSNLKAIELGKKYKNLYPTIGIHPSYVVGANINDLITLLDSHKVYALGEIGIDLYHTKDTYELQKKLFIMQLELAIKYNLPVIIHTRDSFEETYNIVKNYKGKLKGVFHCFVNKVEDAKKVIDLGFLIGIGGVVTFKNAALVHETVKEIPLDKIIVETDSPYLAPMPFRGKTNQPGYTKYVVGKIAELKGNTIDEVEKATTNNAINLFKLD